MKEFHLERGMMSMLGDFYPTGHLFLMFPTVDHARRAEALLVQEGVDPGTISLLTPADVMELVHMFDRHDLKLPTVGYEESTARHFGELAGEGHHALLFPCRTARICESVMASLREAGVSCAVRYRHFVIEDLVTS